MGFLFLPKLICISIYFDFKMYNTAQCHCKKPYDRAIQRKNTSLQRLLHIFIFTWVLMQIATHHSIAMVAFGIERRQSVSSFFVTVQEMRR